MISLAQAAELYGLSPSYLRTIARNGRLEATKIGNSWVTTPQAVEAYIRSREKKGFYRSDLDAS